MPKLYIENGPDRGKSYVISKDGPFFAGRDSAAQVPIPDEMVSRRQFQIELHQKIHHLRDLDSANGTFLNGKRVGQLEALSPNDRIQIGDTIITFQADEPHPLIGAELGGYRILDKIGRGGMGTVYRAMQISLDRIVALKILAPHLVKNTNFINLFIREARAAGGLSHPNIVQVYDVGVHDDVYFFSMEYIPHGSVEDLLNAQGRLSLPHALRVARDAALGLQYAEHKGFIHRDIKPGNLMMGSGGIVKIGDLGIARSTGGEERVSQKDGVSGSPHYIAPEQARGQDIDHRVDIYALGVTLYQMLCGRTPFTGSTPREVVLKQIKESPDPIQERVPGLPEAIAQLVGRLMEKDPDQRVPNATELLAELEKLIEVHGEEAGTHVAAGVGRWRRVMLLIGAALILSAATAGIIFGIHSYQLQQQQEQQRLSSYQEALLSIEGLLADGDLEQAGDELAELGLRELPEQLEARRAAFASALDERLEELRATQAAAAADDALRELEAKLTPPVSVAHAEQLREFATRHAGTPAERLARERAAEIDVELEQRRQLEEEALAHLRNITTKAEGCLLDPPNFNLARRELGRFQVARYGTTQAHDMWVEEIQTLGNKAAAAWDDLQLVRREEIREGRLDDALLEVKLFIEKVDDYDLFQTTANQARALQASIEAELARKATTTGGNGDSLLLTRLGPIWKRLAHDFDAAQAVKDLPARSDLSGAEAELRARIKDALEGLQTALATPVPVARNKRRVRLQLESNDSTLVNIIALSDRGVLYRPRGATIDRWARWNELARPSRIQLLQLWTETPESSYHAGFLLYLNGEPSKAEAAWTRARTQDPALAPRIESLRELLVTTLPQEATLPQKD